jgi:hypothetical protein
MVNIDDIVLAVIDHLNEHELPCMIVGSLATNVNCNPRSTEGGDFVVEADLAQLARAIPAGADDLSIRVSRPAFKLPASPLNSADQPK